MRERLVRLSHSVSVFFLLDSAAGVVVSVHQFRGELVAHIAVAHLSCGRDDPTNRESLSSLGYDFDGYLIVGTAYSPRFYFEKVHNVVHGLVEYIHRLDA